MLLTACFVVGFGKVTEIAVGCIVIVTAVIGTTVAVDNRYAKVAEVQEQLQDYYERNLKLRILEIDLKEEPSPSDKALKQYLQQEIKQNQ
jgi:uncharacterized membrane protein